MTCYSSHGMMSVLASRMGTCDTSRGLMEKMAAKSNSTFEGMTKQLFSIVTSHLESHLLLDFDSEAAHCPVRLLGHARFRLPQFLGGFKTRWMRTFKATLNGSEIKELSDSRQQVVGYAHGDRRTMGCHVTFLYFWRQTGICFHTRNFIFTSFGVPNFGEVFSNALEEPYRFSYLMKRTEDSEVDRTLVSEFLAADQWPSAMDSHVMV
mmetsp:Transcript_24356/g.79585  ORF Transcript_24356/g.79585 Transcript_24356/m.79585 type:complete len:208 (-) Transcript_24356:176-799(-)